MSRQGFLLTSALVATLGAVPALADTFHNTSGSIKGSLCVGNDCVTSESFGFDTIRLKENNLRIHFDDTSTSASFPNNDWRILINASGNGGTEYYAIEDASAGTTPFRVQAGAGNHALWIDSSGDVGLGENNPAVELHITNGDSPTLRLNQDGSSGFAPQTWDLAGNETNFFIRDATNGSTLPFRIEPGAPTSAIHIDNDGGVAFGSSANLADTVRMFLEGGDNDITVTTSGDIGMNSSAPATPLHIVREFGSTRDLIRLENDEGVNLRLIDTSANGEEWFLQSDNGQARLNTPSNAGIEFQLTAAGDLTILGEITTSGSCSGGCDLVFEPDYELRSIEEHAQMMWADKHLPAVGPTAESGPMNLSETVGALLNELEHAHIYIDQLNSRIGLLEERLIANEG